jgi:hypothetical protein
MTSPTNPLRPDQIDPTRSIQPSQEIEEGTGSNSFAEMMQSPATMTQSSQAPSPMNILPGTKPISGPSYDTMQTQLVQSGSNISDMQQQMNTPGLRIKPQDKEMLVKNMTNASSNLRAANTKLGINPGPSPEPAEGPFGKFLSLINDGTAQIASAKQRLANISSSGGTINPAEMLMVQVKINQAQQQIEFSSILLSKVVDDFKQLMNIQI